MNFRVVSIDAPTKILRNFLNSIPVQIFLVPPEIKI